MTNVFDVTDFGAVGDGKTDCTLAFQTAIDKAEKVKGAVAVPPGIYLCSTVYLKPSVCIYGFNGWGYRETGGSVIKLLDGESHCLIDMSGAFGGRVRDLQLLGNHCAGENVHGIYVRWENQDSRLSDDPVREDNVLPETCQIGFREDSITVEGCHIKNFSGDAIHLQKIWGFTVRNCMILANGGNAMYVNGWDGWITDCVMHTNHGAGLFSDTRCAAITMTGNRIEWNRNGGINVVNSSLLNITGNYFDRSYGPAISLVGSEMECHDITATGNIFNRSGRYKKSFDENEYENSHLYFDNCCNLAITGNTFLVGNDDFGDGGISPAYGIAYKRLNSCCISGNTLFNGALKKKLVDLGGHMGDNCIMGNAGIKDQDICPEA